MRQSPSSFISSFSAMVPHALCLQYLPVSLVGVKGQEAAVLLGMWGINGISSS